MTACGIAFRENGISAKLDESHINFMDTENDQYVDIRFWEENSYEN